ncbi:hypothetical protein [Rhodococcus sp. SJ-3]|uniref:hypothetical protein n=1 Tax=Rhodococcus sp. SJ-3 TaxID=3454628 RepID=UPI003F793179
MSDQHPICKHCGIPVIDRGSGWVHTDGPQQGLHRCALNPYGYDAEPHGEACAHTCLGHDKGKAMTPEDFGRSRHGVHIYQNEDGYWYAYGHHSARRFAAAMNHEAREFDGDVADITLDMVRAEMRQCWGNNVRRDSDGIRWDFCKPGDPGAFPFTAVHP